MFNPWVGKIPWRREQLPTLVSWPGEIHGQRSLAGYSPWVAKSQTWMSNFHYFTYGSLCSTGWVKWSWFWVPNHAPLYPMFLDLFILADGSSPLPQQRWDPGSRRRLLQKGCTSVAVLCSLSKLWELVMDREAGMLQSMGSQRHDWVTELNWSHCTEMGSALHYILVERWQGQRYTGLKAYLQALNQLLWPVTRAQAGDCALLPWQ